MADRRGQPVIQEVTSREFRAAYLKSATELWPQKAQRSLGLIAWHLNRMTSDQRFADTIAARLRAGDPAVTRLVGLVANIPEAAPAGLRHQINPSRHQPMSSGAESRTWEDAMIEAGAGAEFSAAVRNARMSLPGRRPEELTLRQGDERNYASMLNWEEGLAGGSGLVTRDLLDGLNSETQERTTASGKPT